MLFTEEKLIRGREELRQKRYFGHQAIAPFAAMEAKLSEDESNLCIPEKIEGSTFGLNDVFEGRDRYLWIQKEVTFPEAKEGCEIVGLFDFGETGHGGNSGFESLLYVDGHPYQGVDANHQEVVFSNMGGKKATLTFMLWTGLEGGGPHRTFQHRCKSAHFAYLHKKTDDRVRLKTGETEKSTGGYEYRWTSRDGKRHSIYAPTLERLREMELELEIDKRDGIKADVKALTVNDCFKLWKELKRGIKDSTFQNYIYMYELFVMPTFGKKRVVQVQKSDVKRFYNDLVDNKILRISTVDNIHNVLHQVFQVAVDDNYIRQNPTDRMLKELRIAHGHEVEKRKALSLAQQDLFLNYIKEKPQYQHWYPVFFIMLNTGMRVGEITGLRWRDVDLENGVISVNHTLVYYNHRDEVGTYYSINTPKTEAGIREIPMVAGVKEAFEMERAYQEELGIKSEARIDGYDDFIFVNRYGQVQHHGTLNKALKRIMRDCNDEILLEHDLETMPVLLPNFSCHVLRHTFATRLCESGINIKVIQSVLGHVDISTTMDIYVDVMSETKKKELANFDGYMASARA